MKVLTDFREFSKTLKFVAGISASDVAITTKEDQLILQAARDNLLISTKIHCSGDASFVIPSGSILTNKFPSVPGASAFSIEGDENELTFNVPKRLTFKVPRKSDEIDSINFIKTNFRTLPKFIPLLKVPLISLREALLSIVVQYKAVQNDIIRFSVVDNKVRIEYRDRWDGISTALDTIEQNIPSDDFGLTSTYSILWSFLSIVNTFLGKGEKANISVLYNEKFIKLICKNTVLVYTRPTEDYDPVYLSICKIRDNDTAQAVLRFNPQEAKAAISSLMWLISNDKDAPIKIKFNDSEVALLVKGDSNAIARAKFVAKGKKDIDFIVSAKNFIKYLTMFTTTKTEQVKLRVYPKRVILESTNSIILTARQVEE